MGVGLIPEQVLVEEDKKEVAEENQAEVWGEEVEEEEKEREEEEEEWKEGEEWEEGREEKEVRLGEECPGFLDWDEEI